VNGAEAAPSFETAFRSDEMGVVRFRHNRCESLAPPREDRSRGREREKSGHPREQLNPVPIRFGV